MEILFKSYSQRQIAKKLKISLYWVWYSLQSLFDNGANIVRKKSKAAKMTGEESLLLRDSGC